MKAVCLACTVDTSTGQTPFLAMHGQEATLGIGYIPYLMLTGKWSYQTGLKVPEGFCWYERDTTSHSKPEFSILQNDHVQVWRWVGLDFWTEDCTWKLWQVKIILGWTVQDYQEIFPALGEVMEVYERGKPRTVSIDVLKEFRVKLNCTRIDTCLRNRYGVGHLLHL